ncbi:MULTISPECIES: hypothetical protein [unclassified Flavobacterium]|jgi:hypothetical protein|uniref:hypothetical protein n=1 Tax=unclassified Flavobacterium TaxID=196869 RepID=UPI0025C4A13E|nr:MULTISPECIES: hypothetical protein [unclassified Flavobacterium]
MKNRNETEALNELIIAEELKYTNDLEQLKDQFYVAYESMRPINLVKNLFHEVTASPEIKRDLVSNAIGLGTGFLTKTLLLGTLHNPVKKVFGTVFEFAVANLVSKHSDGIKLIGGNLLKHFFKKSKN